MAEIKTLNTRIKLRIDTLENWNSSSAILLPGEVAFATVAASAGTGLTEPVVMAKIATEEGKTFSELPWAFHAKAADVLASCKSEAGLKAFVNGVIADAGIASSDAMEALAGRVTTAEGKITTLENELNTADTGLKARMTAAEGDIIALEGLVGDTAVADQITAAINKLDLANTYAAKSLEKTVSDHVADTVAHVTSDDKIKWNNALQAADVVTGSANGTISVKGSDVAVKGLGSAAYTEASAYDAAGAAADALAEAKTYAEGQAASAESAAKTHAETKASAAETAAKAYADGLAVNYDAAGSAAAAQSAAEATAKAYTDSLVGDKSVSEQIEALDLANTYAAKSHKHVKADITDFAHTHEISEVNGLQGALDGKQAVGDYATKAEAQGYADAKDEAIAAAKKAGDDAAAAASVADGKAVAAQNDVDALETYVGTIPSDEKYADITSVIGYINKKSEETLAAASGNSTETAASVKAALDTYKTENDAAVKANADAIADLDELVGDTAVATQITNATSPLDARIKAIEDDYLTSDDKKELTDADAAQVERIAALEGTIVGLSGAMHFEGVKDEVPTDVTGYEQGDVIIVGNKEYVLNGDAFVEFGDASVNAEAITALTGRVTTAEGKISTLEGEMDQAQADIDAVEGRMDTAEGKITALETASATHALASDLTALAGRVTTVEGDLNAETTGLKARMTAAEADIDALEELVGDEPVADQITAAIEALKIGDYAKAADLTAAVARIAQNETDIEALEGRMDTAEGDIDTLETEVAKKANDADLAAIAKTGNVNDLVQTEGDVLIFDCGTSAV